MAKKKKVVTKDAPYISTVSGSPLPSTSPVAGQSGYPVSGNTTMTAQSMSWPAPDNWHLQGHDAAKKVALEYIVTTSQYLSEQDIPRKMELALKMTSLAESMIHGIQIATESAELLQQKIRTGDESAKINLANLNQTLKALANSVWIHNFAALRGAPGLQIRLVDGQLVGRTVRATGLPMKDDGIPLAPGVDPNSLWMSSQPVSDAQGLPMEPPPDEMSEVSAENPSETPLDSEIIGPEDAPPNDMEQELVEGEEEPLPEDEIDPNAEVDVEEEIPEEGLEPTEEEVGEDALAQFVGEETPEGEEEIPEEGMEEEVAEGEIPLDEEMSEEDMMEEQPMEEEVEGEGEIPEESEEETSEDTFYCIVCDREVTEEDIAECDNPDCPFREERENVETEEAENGEEETEAEAEEGPSTDSNGKEEEQKEVESEEEEPKKDKKEEKHYIMVDYTNHDRCERYTFKSNDFTGLDIEYCKTCNKALSYSFDQTHWTSEDAKRWMEKKIKRDTVKTKSPEEDVIEQLLAKLDKDIEVKSPSEEIEIDETILESALERAMERSPFNKELKAIAQEFRYMTGL